MKNVRIKFPAWLIGGCIGLVYLFGVYGFEYATMCGFGSSMTMCGLFTTMMNPHLIFVSRIIPIPIAEDSIFIFAGTVNFIIGAILGQLITLVWRSIRRNPFGL